MGRAGGLGQSVVGPVLSIRQVPGVSWKSVRTMCWCGHLPSVALSHCSQAFLCAWHFYKWVADTEISLATV